MKIVKVPQYLEAAELAMQSTLNELQNWLPVSYELKQASNRVLLEFQGMNSLTQILGFTMDPHAYYKGHWELKLYHRGLRISRSFASSSESELWQIYAPNKFFLALKLNFHQVRFRDLVLEHLNQEEVLVTRAPTVSNPYYLMSLPEKSYRATLADCQKNLYEKTRWLEKIGAKYYQLHNGISLSHQTLIDIHQSLFDLLDDGLLVFTPDWNLNIRSYYLEWTVLNPKACIVPVKSGAEEDIPIWDATDERRKLAIPGWCLYMFFTENA